MCEHHNAVDTFCDAVIDVLCIKELVEWLDGMIERVRKRLCLK